VFLAGTWPKVRHLGRRIRAASGVGVCEAQGGFKAAAAAAAGDEAVG
jgi:hypothetical protein